MKTSSTTSEKAVTTTKVVLAGFGRSGSSSLKAALERLGYNACHGYDIIDNFQGSHKHLAQAFIDRDINRILTETEVLGYDATLEYHGTYWREIHQLRPNAKLLVVIRDYDRWEKSVRALYKSIQPVFWYPLRLLPPMDRAAHLSLAQFQHSMISIGIHVTDEEGWEHLRNYDSDENVALRRHIYERFVKDASALTMSHPDKAMKFDMRQGYDALCDFLKIANDTDCPRDKPFPHLNTGGEIKVQGMVLFGMEISMYCLIFGCIYVMGRVAKRSSSRKNYTKAD